MRVSADCLLPRAAPNQRWEEADAVLALSAAPVGAAPLLQARGKLGLPTLSNCATESSSTLFKAASDLTKVT